jgi:hypothetical protein
MPRPSPVEFNRTLPLLPHAAAPDAIVAAIAVEVSLAAGALCLRYRLRGGAGRLLLPPPRPARHADGLWRQTCCEVFIGAVGTSAYHEFNFSPSGEWAGYAFSAYRQRVPALLPTPAISVSGDGDRLDLIASLPVEALPVAAGAHDIGLAVVVTADDGRLAHWALRHAAGAPDFHQRDTFALRLEPVDADRP